MNKKINGPVRKSIAVRRAKRKILRIARVDILRGESQKRYIAHMRKYFRIYKMGLEHADMFYMD